MKARTALDVNIPRIVPAGDEAVLIELGRAIQRTVNRRVHALARLLTDGEPRHEWLREVVPAYASLLVYYDPDRIEYGELRDVLAAAVRRVDAEVGTEAEAIYPSVRAVDAAAEDGEKVTGGAPTERRRVIEIPVRYGGDDGPDLQWVADRVGMTPDQLVAAHSAPTYVVYMLGFTPGFCYLGDLPAELAVERLPTPRLSLPAGAVAIGGRQTGIYSLDNSPGGWRWIGRTSMALWNPGSDRPFLLRAGDEVRFVPI